MAYLAVNKDGSEIISEYELYRNGFRKVIKPCYPEICDKCFYKNLSHSICLKDKDGNRYTEEIYSAPPKMDKETAIKLLSFWDNYEYDPECNEVDFTVSLPKGSIKKLIGRELTWEDEPVYI